ncbi:MAG: hypothetical protein EZS28_026578 [Streblomastix strix]|uniref:Uncharacterized protein n=1 Tax=Streblomastix strix TaxID=222440 RepID=A0A5J4V674_9EUKA|nr:MAG: hypothetical protein EZS28_026578 [Streblomastix strix]
MVEQQTKIVNNGYGRVIYITFSTAEGKGEEQDEEIQNRLQCIFSFLNELHAGNNYQLSFQPLPLLVRRAEEQLEEEGAREELEAQINNNGIYGHIKSNANDAKVVTLKCFIHRD